MQLPPGAEADVQRLGRVGVGNRNHLRLGAKLGEFGGRLKYFVCMVVYRSIFIKLINEFKKSSTKRGNPLTEMD